MMEYTVEAVEPYRHNRDAQSRGDHPHAWLERVDLPRVGAFALGENQERVALRHQLADVAQRLARARFALRQGKRIEEERGEVVVRAVGQPLPPRERPRIEMGPEELLRHRRRDAVAPTRRQGA